MADTMCERVARCREKRKKRHLAIAQGLFRRPFVSTTTEGLHVSDQAGPSEQPSSSNQPSFVRKRTGDRSLMDFSAEAASVNRQHRLDRIRSRKSCRRSLQFSAVDDASPTNLPFDRAYIEALKESYPDRSYYGGPTHECPYCGAVFWYQECVKSASAAATRKIIYNLCCRGGKIHFKPYKEPPAPLADLLRFDGDACSKRFLRQI